MKALSRPLIVPAWVMYFMLGALLLSGIMGPIWQGQALNDAADCLRHFGALTVLDNMGIDDKTQSPFYEECTEYMVLMGPQK